MNSCLGQMASEFFMLGAMLPPITADHHSFMHLHAASTRSISGNHDLLQVLMKFSIWSLIWRRRRKRRESSRLSPCHVARSVPPVRTTNSHHKNVQSVAFMPATSACSIPKADVHTDSLLSTCGSASNVDRLQLPRTSSATAVSIVFPYTCAPLSEVISSVESQVFMPAQDASSWTLAQSHIAPFRTRLFSCKNAPCWLITRPPSASRRTRGLGHMQSLYTSMSFERQDFRDNLYCMPVEALPRATHRLLLKKCSLRWATTMASGRLINSTLDIKDLLLFTSLSSQLL